MASLFADDTASPLSIVRDGGSLAGVLPALEFTGPGVLDRIFLGLKSGDISYGSADGLTSGDISCEGWFARRDLPRPNLQHL
ncbi:MAG: hypothetical protein AAFP90_18820 [Planctomycetota bacterium]